MKQRSIRLIIGLMSFALLGVVAMQYYFIRESYTLKSQLFDQAVNDALKNVAFKLEKNEAAIFLAHKAEKERKFKERRRENYKNKLAEKNSSTKKKPVRNKENPALAYIRKLKANQAKSDSIFRLRDSILRNRYPNILVYNGPAPELPENEITGISFDFEEISDEYGFRQNVVRRVFTERAPIKLNKSSKDNVIIDSIRQYIVNDPVLGPVVKTIGKPNYLSNISPKELAAAERKAPTVNQAKSVKNYLDSAEKSSTQSQLLSDIAFEFQQVDIPLDQRIKPDVIDSLLLVELANNGVLLQYNYKISSNQKDSIIYLNASAKTTNFEPENTYKAVLFPKDMVRDGGVLTVTFPDKNNLILKNMDSILASSAGLLLILIGCFAYTIFSILRQKKVSEMKTDFINNMTHEFKTPVATIMIASEALKDPEVNEDKNRVNRLAGIIYDENVRLGNHIERVLHIAKIDRNDLKIDHNKVDLHDLIHAVVDSMSLQLQKKNTNVSMNLKASDSIIMGDELHISNVIFNLLDNANKYSIDNPEINITTLNAGSEIVIKVADNGIGMGREQQKKIFEQFYRIPTGNLHDVKGFGLGLSYVNNMVKRMGGSVNVKSEKDKGSEFELRFPTA